MKPVYVSVMVAALCGSVGCASNPDKITTSYVSPVQYNNYDCDQIAKEMENVSRRAGELHGRLKKTADNDAAQMAVGMIIFWPALFFLEGGDGPEASEYARLKGEKEALEQAAIEKKCTSNAQNVVTSPSSEPGVQSSDNSSPDQAASLARTGEKWKYRLVHDQRSVGTISIEVLEANGSSVKERITRDGYPTFVMERVVDTTFNPARFLAQVTLPGGYQLSEVSPYFPEGTQLKTGTSWNEVPGEFYFNEIGKHKLLAKVIVVGEETIQLPSGTFRTWKLQAELPEARGAQQVGEKLTCTYWYSPVSRRTVKMQFSSRASIAIRSSTEIYELVAYESR